MLYAVVTVLLVLSGIYALLFLMAALDPTSARPAQRAGARDTGRQHPPASPARAPTVLPDRSES